MDSKNIWEDAEAQHQSLQVVTPQPLPSIPALSQPIVHDANLHPTAMNPQLDDDIQTAKKIVSFSITLIMIVSLAYTGFILFDGDALTGYRPGDAALESQEVYRDLIQADQVNLNGAGVTVCIVDSGINPDHQDLDGLSISKWQDFVGGANNPYDDHGHGTSMAGILVADGWIKGIAPKVELLVAKALAENGTGDDSVVAEAIDWCAENGAHLSLIHI